ncbi:putative sodium-coupled neutral amino acid transporter 8 [Dissostichus eleginoides]|uniref:Sodium-coupled neutral amino acid transporter 8 n=1 Tax=Dissostichus eleginoides TaxID=100907 RepID=A0AAD9BXE8_DISEL|nr:putative sodium-coupled neutral amino acid transporter 8 [Dissostichus eleginoides]
MEELARESINLLARSASHSGPPRLGSFGAVFIMLKSALGAGLLNFPWAFQKAGGVNTALSVELTSERLVECLSLMCMVSEQGAVVVDELGARTRLDYDQLWTKCEPQLDIQVHFEPISQYSGLIILGYASSVSRQNTYQDVVREVCGGAVGQLCEICFCFNLFMICVAFLVVVQDQLEKLSVSLYETVTGSTEMPYHWYTDQRFYLFIMCVIIILPLSIPKEIGIQKYTSVLGTLAATYLCVAVIVKYYLMESHNVIITPEHSEGSMENKKLLNWVIISVVSMFFCLLIYTLTGVYGFMTFGRAVASDILMSYPGNDVPMIISRLLFGISIITIYPIILLLGRRRWGVVTHSFETRCRVVLTVIWITVTLLIAMFVPDMGEVISVIGGISAFFIFIFPGLCLVFTMQSEPVSPRVRVILTVWGVITIVVGSFIFGQSTTIAIMEIYQKF